MLLRSAQLLGVAGFQPLSTICTNPGSTLPLSTYKHGARNVPCRICTKQPSLPTYLSYLPPALPCQDPCFWREILPKSLCKRRTRVGTRHVRVISGHRHDRDADELAQTIQPLHQCGRRSLNERHSRTAQTVLGSWLYKLFVTLQHQPNPSRLWTKLITDASTSFPPCHHQSQPTRTRLK